MVQPLALIAAFGGGAFAASIGALAAFIMTGVFSVAGAVAFMCGAGDAGGILINNFAFGSFFGPHISFAAGVAAAAYAKKKGLNENGADIVTCTAKYNKADVILVGAVFGVIGYLIKELVIANVFAGTVSPRLVTDAPGITVFISGILVRLIFGGKLSTLNGKSVVSKGDSIATTLVIGITYSLVVAGVYVWGAGAGGENIPAFAGMYHVLIFGLAAVGLVFAEMGQAFVGCHHIVIIAAEATVQSYATMGPYGALCMGVIFGTISALIADIEGNLINSGTDSHIDNPACAIFIMTFVVNACFPAA